MEHEANLLWINSDSSYNFHEAWLRENFRKNERGQVMTVTSDNVLEPPVINKVNTLLLQSVVVVAVCHLNGLLTPRQIIHFLFNLLWDD